MQPIGQLHQHHPDITGHGQKHAPQVLGLGLGLVGEMDAPQLGDPLHQGPHLGAKLGLDFLRRYLGVFDHVVEEAGGDDRTASTNIAQQIGYGDGMDDVGLA